MTSAGESPATVSAGGVTARIPPGWHPRDVDGALLALVQSAPQAAPPASAVVTVDPLDGVDDVVEWYRACRAALDAQCRHLEVVEIAEATVAGRPARRLVALHAVVGVGGVVLDQWLVPTEGRGVVLSCTAPALAYDTLATVFADLAGTVSVEEPA